MSTKRQRMTWAALNRGAAAAPALPGYDVEDQDHPAHTQDDPEAPDYMIGGPSDFAEDVHQPPYGDSGEPALPGYGVEDLDHPAHKGQVGRQANLMNMVRQKAAKALKLAQATLGKKADWGTIEDQAFSYMSMDDSALDASLDRLSGGFLANDEDGDDEDGDDEDGDDEDPIMARINAMQDEINALRRQANQNDPSGPTLGASGKSADEVKRDQAAIAKAAAQTKQARAKLARLFTACDLDNDGFVTEDDWMGPADVFAALDTDHDGILAKHEVLAGEVPEAFKKQWADEGEDKGEDKGEKSEKSAAKKSEDAEDEKAAAKKGGKKSNGDAVEDEKAAAKKSGKKAFGHLADFDDDEMDMLSAMMDEEDSGATACGTDVMASKKSDDDEDGDEGGEDSDEGGEDNDEGGEGSDKEASFFAGGFDPMGLADSTTLTAADRAAFHEVFGSEDEGEETEDEGDGAEASKKANTRLASLVRPQPRKASSGVQRVGTQTRVAGTRNEVGELSRLWASDPDVSKSFA